MSGEQGSIIAPMSEMGYLTTDQFTDYCADLWEEVEAGNMTIEQAAERMFGPEPEITYTRWTA